MSVEKQIEEVMRKVEFMRGAAQFGSPCQLEAAHKDVEATIRTLLSSAQSGEQSNPLEAWEYPDLPSGAEACEFNSYATVYDADDMREYVDADRKLRRPARALEVERKAINGQELYVVREAFFKKYGREPLADDVSFAKMVVAHFASQPNWEV